MPTVIALVQRERAPIEGRHREAGGECDLEHFSFVTREPPSMGSDNIHHRPIIYLMREGYALWTVWRGHEVEPIAYHADWKGALERAARHACSEGALQLVDHEGQTHFVDCDGLRAFARRWYIGLDL